MKAIEKARTTRPGVGVIGVGNFGECLGMQLAEKGFDVTVYDAKKSRMNAAERNGLKTASIEEVAGKKIVFVSVPMAHFEEALRKIKDSVRPGSSIFDVTSVKVPPAELMRKYLPENVEIIGTHPLFGPESIRQNKGIGGLSIVVCGIHTKEGSMGRVKKFLKTLGLNAIERTPEDHDREMAETQALAHFVGQALKEAGLEKSGVASEELLTIRDLVKNDSRELFETIQVWNPYAKSERERFLGKIREVNSQLEETDTIEHLLSKTLKRMGVKDDEKSVGNGIATYKGLLVIKNAKKIEKANPNGRLERELFLKKLEEIHARLERVETLNNPK